MANAVRQIRPCGGVLVLDSGHVPPRHRVGGTAVNTGRGVARTDLNMLAGLGGRERSLEEYAALLGAQGFVVAATMPLGFEFTLVEAHRRRPPPSD